MTRRELREHIFRELFTAQFYAENEEEKDEQMKLYFSHTAGEGLDYPPDEVGEEEQKEVVEKTKAVLDHLDHLLTDLDRPAMVLPVPVHL